MSVQSRIHSILFHIIHLCATFIITICSYWTSFTSKVQYQNVTKSIDFLPAGYYTVPSAASLAATGLKTPLHLGLLVMEDAYCLATLGLVVSFAYSVGTRHISLYSKTGFSPSEILNLQKVIRKPLDEISNGTPDLNIRKIASQSNCDDGRGIKGSELDDTLHIHLVDPGDGQRMIADLTKQLAIEVKEDRLNKNNITTEYVNSTLQDVTKCPDPDLVLSFGSVPSFCGYLPWQLRLTEIISLPRLKEIKQGHLIESIMKFSKIERRFGK